MKSAGAFICGMALVTIAPWLLLEFLGLFIGNAGLFKLHVPNLVLPVAGGVVYWVGQRALGWQQSIQSALVLGVGIALPFAPLLAHLK